MKTLLLRHGMVRASFIPPDGIRDLRDLTRCRKWLVVAIAREKNQISKVLEDAIVKLISVLNSFYGVSGQATLERMLVGKFLPSGLSEFAKARESLKKAETADAILAELGLTWKAFPSAVRELVQKALAELDVSPPEPKR